MSLFCSLPLSLRATDRLRPFVLSTLVTVVGIAMGFSDAGLAPTSTTAALVVATAAVAVKVIAYCAVVHRLAPPAVGGSVVTGAGLFALSTDASDQMETFGVNGMRARLILAHMRVRVHVY